MNASTNAVSETSKAELERRLAEYCRSSFEHRVPAQVVYQDPYLLCPWSECTRRIDGIHFQLDQWLKPTKSELFREAWWKGEGLVGRCPGCGQYVLFSVTAKSKVEDVSGYAVLPDDWYEHANLVTKS